MKLALVQFSPIFGDVESNNNKIFNYCNSVDCDIIVFPELATSGYDFLNRKECMGYSLDLESEFFSPYKELAATQRKLIVIGYPERQGNKVYNSAALIFSDNKLKFALFPIVNIILGYFPSSVVLTSTSPQSFLYLKTTF